MKIDLGNDQQSNIGKFEEIQENFIEEILKLFKIANIAVGTLVIVLACLDELNLLYRPGFEPQSRIISSNIMLSLIGATTIQVGTIAITIANYLFKKSARS